MECPCCGESCVQTAEMVLSRVEDMYQACRGCAAEICLDKSTPLKNLPPKIERCPECGKATLDGVMLEALRILKEVGLRDEKDCLKSVGWPLICPGYPLAYPPRLGPRTLVLMSQRLSAMAAEEVVKRVPEVRGIILSRGVSGMADSKAVEGELLAGCDIRADIIRGSAGELVIYKSQSKIHVEFPRPRNLKVEALERYLFHGRSRSVVDALCGPGTLGLMASLMGVKKAVLNDIWLPAVENAVLNIEVNKGLLGIDKIERFPMPKNKIGDKPVLVCKASGDCDVEVYHGDIRKLFTEVEPADLCIIDQFPGISTKEMERYCDSCRRVAVI